MDTQYESTMQDLDKRAALVKLAQCFHQNGLSQVGMVISEIVSGTAQQVLACLRALHQWRYTEAAEPAPEIAELRRLREGLDALKKELTDDPTFGSIIELVFYGPLREAEAENRRLRAVLHDVLGIFRPHPHQEGHYLILTVDIERIKGQIARALGVVESTEAQNG
jgi:hypothetical protein